MNQINQNYFKNGVLKQVSPNFRSTDSVAPSVPLPDIYYNPNDSFEKSSIKDSLKQYDMFDMFSWLEHPILMLGTSIGLLFGIGQFSKSFDGEFNKSIVGRASHFGDKIEKSALIQSDAVQKSGNAIKKGWESTKKFLCKNDAIKAMFETPGRPEWGMPKNEMLPTEQRLLENFNRIVSELELIDKDVNITQSNTTGLLNMSQSKSKLALKNLGLDDAEREYLKGIYGDMRISKITNQEEAVNRVLLKRLGTSENEITSIVNSADASKIVREKLRNLLGFTEEELKEIATDTTGKKAKIVLEKLERLRNIKAFRIGACHYDALGKIQPLERHITMESVRNNLKSILDKDITKTGKFMARATQIAHKCLTFGGGKLAVLLFIAPIFTRAILNSKKADKKEKVGTFTHDVVSGVSWIATFPLGMKLMHAIGGMQFAGMSKEQVEEFRTKLAQLEEDNKAGKFTTRAEYKNAKKEVMKLRKAGRNGQSLISRIGRKIGGFLEIGNENPKGWIKPNGNFIMNKLRRSGNFFKNTVGVPLRFLLFMMGINAALEGVISKCCGKIFGKHYDAEKHEEHSENKKAQEKFTKEDLQERLIKAQEKKLKAIEEANNQTTSTKAKTAEEEHKQEKIVSENKPQEKVENSTITGDVDTTINTPKTDSKTTKQIDNYTYIPSSENVIKQQKEENAKQKYIPSQEAANISKTYDNSGLEAALRRADRAEANAINILAGNFSNM